VDRRSFIGSCTVLTAASFEAIASDAKPKPYARALLVDERGQPLKAASLKPRTNYVFHYPYVATPVFLLDLGKPAPPQSMSTHERDTYAWPGGVGRGRSIVAYSAICAHKLVYPTRDVSFISFRKTRAQRGVQDELIHCCAEHSQYDPARGALVMAGPAPQPLAAVLLVLTQQLYVDGYLAHASAPARGGAGDIPAGKAEAGNASRGPSLTKETLS